MRTSILFSIVPVVLGCANPGSDSCASYISGHVASCATFLSTTITTTTNLPAWATACSNKPSAISKECVSSTQICASRADHLYRAATRPLRLPSRPVWSQQPPQKRRLRLEVEQLLPASLRHCQRLRVRSRRASLSQCQRVRSLTAE